MVDVELVAKTAFFDVWGLFVCRRKDVLHM